MSYSFYVVRRNDQLFQIMRAQYGSARFAQDRAALTELVLANNPDITNIDRIFPGQVIMLPGLGTGSGTGAVPVANPQAVALCRTTSHTLSGLSNEAKGLMERIDYFSVAKTGGERFIDQVMNNASRSRQDIHQIVLNYYRKEAGTISRGQYDYRRAVRIRSIDKRFGLLGNLVHPGRKAGEVLRIEAHAPHRTESLLDSARTLDRAAKLAKKGLVVLRVADLAVTGTKIATASSDKERTAIVLDTISENAGTAAGIALAVLAFGNPVGLTGLAIVAVAGVAGGTIGKIIGDQIEQNVLYDSNGQRLETKADLAWRFFR